MRIACVDKTAADRVKLQKLFDRTYEECRHAVGHMNVAATYPASKEEVIINKPPDIVAVGPEFSIEESYISCREIRAACPQVPIILFFPPQSYSLRTLRRFQLLATDIFTTEEVSVRLVHRLMLLELSSKVTKSGKLIVVTGVKGGVGTTSIVSALAHGAEAVGKTALVMDLSPLGSFVQYMCTQRRHSPDYAAVPQDGCAPDRALVERCLTTGPNGVTVLLPPSGASDVRELWLRDSGRFEITLSIIEILKDMYDVILVDTAGVEGVLNFALNTRAHARVLISSNDPASVHLLNSKLSDVAEIPGDAQVHILLNLLLERSLLKEDIDDFISNSEHFNEYMTVLAPVPYDSRARSWIGTGNTFYTESAASVQSSFDQILSTLLLTSEELEAKREHDRRSFGGLKNLFRKSSVRPSVRRKRISGQLRALPAPSVLEEDQRVFQADRISAAIIEDDSVIYASYESLASSSSSNKLDSELQHVDTRSLDCERLDGFHEVSEGNDGQALSLYQSPERVNQAINHQGSVSLEQVLLLGAAVILAVTALPGFLGFMGNYLLRYFSA